MTKSGYKLLGENRMGRKHFLTSERRSRSRTTLLRGSSAQKPPPGPSDYAPFLSFPTSLPFRLSPLPWSYSQVSFRLPNTIIRKKTEGLPSQPHPHSSAGRNAAGVPTKNRGLAARRALVRIPALPLIRIRNSSYELETHSRESQPYLLPRLIVRIKGALTGKYLAQNISSPSHKSQMSPSHEMRTMKQS